MKGFLEELSGRTFIVRSGEHRLKWDDPYDYAVIFNVPPGSETGEFKACVTKPPTLEAIREAVRILNAAGFKVKWQRLTKAHQYSIEQQHSSNGDIKMARKMPKADDMKTNGKFDKKKFDASLPAAAEALASGETKVHKIVIEDKHGKAEMKIFRSHSHSQDGLDPAIAVALQKLLVDLVNAGTVKVGDVTEGAAAAEQDVLTVTSA